MALLALLQALHAAALALLGPGSSSNLATAATQQQQRSMGRHGSQPRALARRVEAYLCCSCPLWLPVQQAPCIAVGGRAACWPSLCLVMVVIPHC